MSESFKLSHAAAVLLGVLGTLGVVMVNSPRVPVYSPALRQLAAQNKRLTDSTAYLDASLTRYKARLASRDTALGILEAREASALSTSHRLSTVNRQLLDSLAQAHPELVTPLTVLSAGMVSQDSACTESAVTCAMVKDSLRVRNQEADSVLSLHVGLRRDFSDLSRRAITADSVAERQVASLQKRLTVTRIGALVLAIVALVK